MTDLRLDDYQIVAEEFLLSSEFALLADAMGVGKTAPAICAAWKKIQETGRPALVTAPSYLLDNWSWEISRFAPDATVSIANGSGAKARSEALQADADFILSGYSNWSAKVLKKKPKDKEQYETQDLASVESWVSVQPEENPKVGEFQYPELVTRQWSVLIMDEGHRLRGRNSQCTKHVFNLRKARGSNSKSPIWCLTGTPIVNNPSDLYPLFHLWDRNTYKSFWNFVNRWCTTVQTPWSTEIGQLRAGLEEEWQELLGRFSLRRTLKDIPKLQNLEEIHRDYFVQMPASVRKTIDTARREYIVEHENLDHTEFVSGGGALYSKLRQLSTVPPTKEKPKIDFVVDFLEDHRGPVVIYCHYKASARAVLDSLAKTKRPLFMITGDVPAHRRGELVDKWNTEKDGILVATISSLKEGLSLIHASNVIFIETTELPADMDQCVARLKRRGQTEVVHVHWVWAKNTPDIAVKRAVRDRTLGIKRALVSWLREG